MSILLDRRALLSKEKLEIVKVELDKDEYVYVKQMTGRDRDYFEQSLIVEKKNEKGEVIGYDRATEDFRAKLAVITICDENGKLLLQPGDFRTLSENMSAARLDKIINAAQEINKISEVSKENLLKNSEGDQVANSNSGSVEN